MIRRPPRSTLSSSSAASDVYKRQAKDEVEDQGRKREVPEVVRGWGVLDPPGVEHRQVDVEQGRKQKTRGRHEERHDVHGESAEDLEVAVRLVGTLRRPSDVD